MNDRELKENLYPACVRYLETLGVDTTQDISSLGKIEFLDRGNEPIPSIIKWDFPVLQPTSIELKKFTVSEVQATLNNHLVEVEFKHVVNTFDMYIFIYLIKKTDLTILTDDEAIAKIKELYKEYRKGK